MLTASFYGDQIWDLLEVPGIDPWFMRNWRWFSEDLRTGPKIFWIK
jgi:hypothetical protein